MSALHASVAHSGIFTLACTAKTSVGCDLENVSGRTSETWRLALGAAGAEAAATIAAVTGLDQAEACARVWCALESGYKAGANLEEALVIDAHTDDGWLLLRQAEARTATWAFSLAGVDAMFVLAISLFGDALWAGEASHEGATSAIGGKS